MEEILKYTCINIGKCFMISSSFHSSTFVSQILVGASEGVLFVGEEEFVLHDGGALGGRQLEVVGLQTQHCRYCSYAVRVASYLLAQIRHRVLQIHQLIFLLRILN